MRVSLRTLIAIAFCFWAIPAPAADPIATGLWEQVDENGKISGWFVVFERNGVFEGAIVKMFMEPGQNPNPVCAKCTGDQKNAPWLGLTIIKAMDRKGLEYENGTILDPRDGTEYRALMHLSPDGQQLVVRGYLGIALLGRDQFWRRLPDSAIPQIDPTLLAGRLPTPPTTRPNVIPNNGAPKQAPRPPAAK